MKVATIFGIRPDWIKGCMVLRELDRSKLDHVVIHTGQHYSYELNRIFFDQLRIRKPDHFLNVGSGSQGEQTARIIVSSEKAILKEKPDVALVLGDSNSSLAAIAAAKHNVRVARIEAGMRAYDWRMPEETNKRMVDHISSMLFAYTIYQKENLLFEGVAPHKVFVTGNPTVDTIHEFRREAEENRILEKLNIGERDYFLVTVHRAENVDDKTALANILKGLSLVYKKLGKKIIWPLYPRTKNRIRQHKLRIPEGIVILPPQGFLEFLKLEIDASCLITDSGTVQEEGCILQVPCVVVRATTERPETVELRASLVSGVQPKDILRSVELMMSEKASWKHPYGKDVAVKIVRILRYYKKRSLLEEIQSEIVDNRRRICISPYLRRGGGIRRF